MKHLLFFITILIAPSCQKPKMLKEKGEIFVAVSFVKDEKVKYINNLNENLTEEYFKDMASMIVSSIGIICDTTFKPTDIIISDDSENYFFKTKYYCGDTITAMTRNDTINKS